MTSRSIRPTRREVEASLPGDDVVPAASVVMDRAFTLRAAPPVVWPWIVQLGKDRAGWYLPRSVERVVPRRRRAIRHLEPSLLHLAVGDVIPDWGGAGSTFEVAVLDPPRALVHVSTRGHVSLSWAIALTEVGGSTRIHLRLRLGGVRRERLAALGGGFFDWLTILGLAAGLRERLDEVR
ncbi:hypothetical protein ASD11_12200 [Aeromicrobium sp. Root495]|uniref:hypothetical protein n=1 Tax=Aeromicrobium sp. Root495 TaxID=1736550 RepID=UPI0006FA3E43|nr:hypothetical protein [Aeromicrobium sp. Root495]KQY60223.1 hypothetical protein ASD11_12200 [Aeromicrobium sp. Root495]